MSKIKNVLSPTTHLFILQSTIRMGQTYQQVSYYYFKDDRSHFL